MKLPFRRSCSKLEQSLTRCGKYISGRRPKFELLEERRMLAGHSIYRDSVLALNPVGYWRLGEASGTVATDESSNNLDGTYTGGATLGQVGAITGDTNTAVGLDGVNDYVNIDGYQGITGTSARSVSAWIKSSTTGESLPIVSWGLDQTGKKWTFRVDNGTGAIRVENEGGRIIGTTVLTDGQWHNVVVTLADDGSPDISEAKLYVDGALEAISASSSNAVNTGVGSDVRIGRGVLNFFATSDIDEVAIFGSALTSTQIADLYSEGITGGGNTAPTDMALAGNSVPENSANGTTVGTITTTDPDAGETFSYTLTDNAGGRFAIGAGSGQITVANGTLLDFETAQSHNVSVQVTDSASNTYSEAFTIDVTDVTEGGLPSAPIDWSVEIAARVSAGGTVRTANNTATFNSAVSASLPGDVVLLLNGTYGGGTNYSVNGDGLLVTAQNLGGVTFKNGARLVVTGDNNTIGGFNFENLNQKHAIEFNGASDNRFTDNRFVNSGPPDSPKSRMMLVTNSSHRNRFDHNDFAGNRAFGLVIDQPGSGSATSYSQDNRIDHNVFRDILTVTNQGEKVPIQIGAGDLLVEEARTLIDHNEFRDLATKGSIINSKSSGETYINNRFINIPNGNLSLRSGDNKWVEGNFFDNVGRGIQVNGSDHTIINNVIVNARQEGILIHNWGPSAATSYGPNRNNLIANNTIINALGSSIEIGRNWGSNPSATTPTENLRVINNIFQSSTGKLVDVKTSQTNLLIQNNLYYATGGATNGTLGTQSIVGNPNLTATYELNAGSIAIDSGVALPEVTHDFDGNARTGAIDVGAYEFGSVPGSTGGGNKALALWESSFGQTGSLLLADGDQDGDVDGADFLAWQRNAFSVSTSVAEPVALATSAPASSATVSEDFSALAGLQLSTMSSELAPPALEDETSSPIATQPVVLDQAYANFSSQREEIADLLSNVLQAADREVETQLVPQLVDAMSPGQETA